MFCVELADPDSLTHLAQLELFWLVARELDDIQPGHGGAVFPVALEHPWGTIKQPLEPLDQDGAERPRAEVAGHALMAVQDALVVAEQRQDGWKGVLVGDERQVVVEVAGEVVDLQVVVCLGSFGQWRRGRVGMAGRRAAFALVVGRGGWRMVLRRVGGHADALAHGGDVDVGHGESGRAAEAVYESGRRAADEEGGGRRTLAGSSQLTGPAQDSGRRRRSTWAGRGSRTGGRDGDSDRERTW